MVEKKVAKKDKKRDKKKGGLLAVSLGDLTDFGMVDPWEK